MKIGDLVKIKEGVLSPLTAKLAWSSTGLVVELFGKSVMVMHQLDRTLTYRQSDVEVISGTG